MTIPYQVLLMAALAVLAILLIKSMRTLRPVEVVEAFAKDAVANAQRDFGYSLDYSPESIEKLESIVAAKHDELKLNPILPIQVEAIAKVWGAYLGEVIRRKRGGNYFIPHQGPFAGLCVLKIGEDQICPLAKVYKRLSNGEEDNLYAYSQVILGRTGLKRLSLDQKDPGSATSPQA